MLSTNTKGAIAEQAIMLAATKLHVPVWRPTSEHGRADLMFELGDRVWRVQCKWGRLSESGDVIIVSADSCWHTPGRGYVRTSYSETEIDLLAVYCGELDRSFLLPISAVAGMRQIHLRLKPARNGQRACINLAEDYEFDGAIAQLGERWYGIPEVVGSNPTSSTTSTPPPSSAEPVTVGSDPFRDHLGYWMERVARGEEILVTYRGKPRIKLIPALPPLA
jgi:prevent-host-death family protein